MRCVIKGSLLQSVFVLLVLYTFQNNLIVCARLIYKLEPIHPFIPEFKFFNYIVYMLFILVGALPFFWYLFIKLFKKIVDTGIDFLQWKYLFVLPTSYLIYCMVSTFGGIDLLDPQMNDFLILILLNSFAYFSYVAVMKMLLISYDNYKINEQVTLISHQLEMQISQYEKLKEYIEKTSRQRHDWRHHFLIIKDYTEQGNLEGLEAYLNNFSSEYTEAEETPICQNHSIDIILRHYLASAKTVGTDVKVYVNIPEKLYISDHHLCIIFGNLVENAVESCMKQTTVKPFIIINARPIGDQLVISIQNSYSGKILTKHNEFLSTKHEGRGNGISSVRNIVIRNGGNFQVSYENNVFKVSVLLRA